MSKRCNTKKFALILNFAFQTVFKYANLKVDAVEVDANTTN